MIRKLRIKFTVIIMVIVTIMLSVIFGILFTSMQRNFESQAINTLRMIAAEPRRAEHPGRNGEELVLPYFVLQLDSDGVLVSTSGGFYDLSDEAYLLELIQSVEDSGQEIGFLKEHNLRYYRHITPWSYTIAFCDMSNERHILADMLKAYAAVGGISFLVFLAISVVFSKWAVRPVEKAWQEQRQFVADASHELKTPLTVIMTNAELMQSADFDAESQSQFLDGIVVMSRQMRGLVEKMLALARADYQTQKLNFSDVDFSRLAEDSQLTFEGVFFEKELQLEADIAPDIHIRGNQGSLRQVLDILLDNAQKYSSPGGQTTMTLSSAHSKCTLSVSNPGAEISHSDLKNIFRRFYRVDGARSRDGSYGLGLPIAQQIVSQHHGKIWAQSSQGVNTFFVELPMAQHK